MLGRQTRSQSPWQRAASASETNLSPSDTHTHTTTATTITFIFPNLCASPFLLMLKMTHEASQRPLSLHECMTGNPDKWATLQVCSLAGTTWKSHAPSQEPRWSLLALPLPPCYSTSSQPYPSSDIHDSWHPWAPVPAGLFRLPLSLCLTRAKVKISSCTVTPCFKSLHALRDSLSNKETGHRKMLLGFPGGAVVDNLPANAGDTGSSPGLEGSHMPRSN